MRTTDDFVFFWNGPFSQWHPSKFTIGTQTFNCAEQWMMYMKAVTFGDLKIAENIMEQDHPGDQKKLGRRVRGFDDNVWEALSYRIVTTGNIEKFKQNEDLWKVLDETEERLLVEASPYDTIWGVGLRENDPQINDQVNWNGKNLLGLALTETRYILRLLKGHPNV